MSVPRKRQPWRWALGAGLCGAVVFGVLLWQFGGSWAFWSTDSTSYRVRVSEQVIEVHAEPMARYDVILDYDDGASSGQANPYLTPRLEHHEWGVRIVLPRGVYPVPRDGSVSLRVLVRHLSGSKDLQSEWREVYSRRFVYGSDYGSDDVTQVYLREEQ